MLAFMLAIDSYGGTSVLQQILVMRAYYLVRVTKIALICLIGVSKDLVLEVVEVAIITLTSPQTLSDTDSLKPTSLGSFSS
jgi:hypothetical protein